MQVRVTYYRHVQVQCTKLINPKENSAQYHRVGTYRNVKPAIKNRISSVIAQHKETSRLTFDHVASLRICERAANLRISPAQRSLWIECSQ